MSVEGNVSWSILMPILMCLLQLFPNMVICVTEQFEEIRCFLHSEASDIEIILACWVVLAC